MAESKNTIIEGSVVKIIDEYSIIFDKGRENNVKKGMKLIIYEEGSEIKDLNNNLLGNIEFIKATVVVTHVQRKFSIAKNSEYRSLSTLDELTKSLSLLSPGERKRLPVNKDDIDTIDYPDAIIKIGDKIRVII